jgi:hypothetical protein
MELKKKIMGLLFPLQCEICYKKDSDVMYIEGVNNEAEDILHSIHLDCLKNIIEHPEDYTYESLIIGDRIIKSIVHRKLHNLNKETKRKELIIQIKRKGGVLKFD